MDFYDKIKNIMAFDVKITTKISILDLLAPYTCRGCGRLGELLCKCCKKYIISAEKRDFVYAVGRREGVLMQLTEDYKYKSIRRTAVILAELIDAVLPADLVNVVVVPLPTVAQHIRERGFDHTLRLAKALARRRGWEVSRCLKRANKTVQVGQDAKTRAAQAARAYEFKGSIDSTKTYLLLDDVWTTGATMKAGKKLLEKNGALRVLGAVVCVGLQ